ncbi:MAG: NAD(P)/FAD-dependent oxidoreductase [Pseudomonadota bacterium]
MRIAVIGAGLAGVTTAYELARDGHEVIVYERRGGIAAEGSFAPACINAPDIGLARVALGQAAIVDRAWRHPATWPWIWRARRAAQQPAGAQRFVAMAQLARHSLQRLREIEDAHELEYERHDGVLAVFRHTRHAIKAQALLAEAPEGATTARWLSPEEARHAEPGLNAGFSIEGALHWPQGQCANGRQFAHALKSESQQMGVRYVFHQEVLAIESRARAASSVSVEVISRPCTELIDSGLPAPTSTLVEDVSPLFDAAIVCSSAAAQHLLRGQLLPLCPAHVHSVTAPLRPASEITEAIGPRGALLDPASGLSIGRLGDRLRIAGRARWGWAPTRPDQSAFDALYRGLDACFPGAARTARAQTWAGPQAVFADGLPAVGPLADGVWANLGHGPQAWAWAPASAQLCADLVGGRSPSLDPAPFAPSRLR